MQVKGKKRRNEMCLSVVYLEKGKAVSGVSFSFTKTKIIGNENVK